MAHGPVDDESKDLHAGCIELLLSTTQDIARDVRAPKHQEHAVGGGGGGKRVADVEKGCPVNQHDVELGSKIPENPRPVARLEKLSGANGRRTRRNQEE